MTRDMRRKRQALAPEACADILAQESHGVLALAGDDFPYAVPLSYVYTDGALYFHCAREGMKLEPAATAAQVFASSQKTTLCQKHTRPTTAA